MYKQLIIGRAEQDTINYMQAVDYECARYSQIIRAALAEHPKLDTETFARYQAEHREIFAKQQLIRETFERDSVRTALPPDAVLRRWWIDTDTGDIVAVVEVEHED